MNGVAAMFFERWRPTRRGRTNWLLLRPPAQASGVWQWRRLPGEAQGDWPPPGVFAQDMLGQTKVALIVPAAHCSHFQVPAPPGLKRQEWPLLLEDVLQQPAEQIQVNCLSRVNGHLELLVMDRARIAGWLADCEALGVAPACLWTEMQLLPAPLPGQLLRWSRASDSCLKRADDKGAQHWLTWPALLGDLPDGWREPTQDMEGAWPGQWAPLERLPNLLENPGARRGKARQRRAWFSRAQRRLAGACAGLALCWGAVAAAQFWQQVPAWKAQVEAVTGPVGSAQQAARQLTRLQARQVDWRGRQQQVAELEAAVSGWLAGQQGWGVVGNYFDGRSWRLVLNGKGPAPALDHWQVMGRAVGATASIEPDDKRSLLTVHFDLGVQP